jgi:hypothetical protein
MTNTGSIIVSMGEDNSLSIAVTGDLTHLEIIGALTMAIHNIEFTAMSAKEK